MNERAGESVQNETDDADMEGSNQVNERAGESVQNDTDDADDAGCKSCTLCECLHDDEGCKSCGGCGELLVCDKCGYFYHLDCSNVTEAPDRNWSVLLLRTYVIIQTQTLFARTQVLCQMRGWAIRAVLQ